MEEQIGSGIQQYLIGQRTGIHGYGEYFGGYAGLNT